MPRRLLALAALALLAPSPASAADDPSSLARAVADEIVHVDSRARGRVSQREAGQLRIRIARRAVGRIKILVIPTAAAERNGGLVSLTNSLQRRLELRGALVVVAGSDIRVAASYDTARAVAAVQEAMGGPVERRIAGDLEQAIDNLARADPGPGGDAGAPGGGSAGDLGANDFLDDLGDTFKTAVFVIIAIFAFIVIVPFAVWGLRARRRRRDSAEGMEIDREKAQQDLVDLGDLLRELDEVDPEMPGIDPAGKEALASALELYDRADRELRKANTRRRLDHARATLNSARSQAVIARRRLSGPESQAASAPGGSGFVNP